MALVEIIYVVNVMSVMLKLVTIVIILIERSSKALLPQLPQSSLHIIIYLTHSISKSGPCESHPDVSIMCFYLLVNLHNYNLYIISILEILKFSTAHMF